MVNIEIAAKIGIFIEIHKAHVKNLSSPIRIVGGTILHYQKTVET